MNTLKNILPITTVKRQLPQLLKQMQGGYEPVIITKDGKAAGVLMSTEEYEALRETHHFWLQVGERSLRQVWDNEEDDTYEQLLKS